LIALVFIFIAADAAGKEQVAWTIYWMGLAIWMVIPFRTDGG
jgi:hypothetical protein